MLPRNFSNVARKKSQVARSSWCSDNTMKILKALFVPNIEGKCSLFLTKKMKRCLFGMYSFLLTDISKAWETPSCFLKCYEDFDYTEIDCMVRIEICLSNDSKSVARF